MLTFGSLFAGIGGFDLGFERAGMKCLWQVEIDDYCNRVLAKHWPDVRRYGDIRDVGKHNLESVDLICGGFPCQPHSVAGKRRGAEDDRNLWPEFLRVVREVRPTWVVGENVPGIVPLYLDTVLSDLESEAYTCWTFNIPACAFDAPHRRERIFVVAYAEQERRGCRSNTSQENHTEGEYLAEGRQSGWRQGLGFGKNGEDVANATGKSRQQERGRSNIEGWSTDKLTSCCQERDWWTVEPDVGRVASRISTTLDGTIRRFGYEYDSNKEAFTKIDSFRRKVLRNMWYERREIEPPPYRKARRSSDDSLYEVSCLHSHERWNLGKRLEKDEELRGLWERICTQSFEETQQLQSELLERIRKKERDEAVASSRVNRLKALGNAVVPQVAEWIGRRIVECNGAVLDD